MAHGLSLTLGLEAASSTLLNTARFDVGWYAARAYAIAASLVVLLVLISETTTLYANLAQSLMSSAASVRRGKTAIGAMAASIAHEVNQPLAASCLEQSSRPPLSLHRRRHNIDQVRDALEAITRDSIRES